jgi:hypothetical protein
MYSDSNLSFSVFTLHVSPEYTNVSLDLHLKNKCFIINHGIQGSIHISHFPIQYSYLLKALSLQWKCCLIIDVVSLDGYTSIVLFLPPHGLAPLMGIRALIITPIVHICKYVDKSTSFSGQLALTVEYYSIFKSASYDKAGQNSETKYFPLVQVFQWNEVEVN